MAPRRKRASSNVRKNDAGDANDNKKKRGKKDFDVNWDYDSDNVVSDEGGPGGNESESETEAEKRETAAEKRVRLAKEYLGKLEDDGMVDSDDSDDESDSETEGNLISGKKKTHDIVNKKLQDDVLRSQGRLRVTVADRLASAFQSEQALKLVQYKGHRLPPTCVAMTETEDLAFTASKDCSIIKWDVETGKRLKRLPGRRERKTDTEEDVDGIIGHFHEVLSLAVSSDGRYLASSSRDETVKIWDVRSDELIDTLKGHRGAVTGVTFRKNSHFLMSASEDRSVRVWNVAEMSYVESLFGHQAEINGIDSMYRDRAVTVSTDRSLRMWKIPEETQLVLRGTHKAALDCVAMIDEVHFVTGSQDGGLALWHTSKKKPTSYIRNAHGGNWITSVASLRNSDAIVSGSSDGLVKIWKANMDTLVLGPRHVAEYAVPGYVNGLACGRSGRVIVAATGQEHRLGRWKRLKEGRNGLHVARIDVDIGASSLLGKDFEGNEVSSNESGSDVSSDDEGNRALQ